MVYRSHEMVYARIKVGEPLSAIMFAVECFRVLLLLDFQLSMIPFRFSNCHVKPLFGNKQPNRTGTHWIVFMKEITMSEEFISATRGRDELRAIIIASTIIIAQQRLLKAAKVAQHSANLAETSKTATSTYDFRHHHQTRGVATVATQ